MAKKKYPSGVNVYQDGAYWVLRMGKRYTGGPVTRQKFDTKRKADQVFEEEQAKRAALGTAAFQLTVSQTAEALNAFHRLEGTGLTLTGVVDQAVKSFRRKEDTVALTDGIKTFLESRKERGRAKATISSYTVFLKRLRETLPDKIAVHEVTEAQFRTVLATWPRTSSRNIALRHLSSFFAYSVKRGWRNDTPTEHIEITREIESPVSILSLDQSRNIMAVCVDDPICRPYLAALAIQLFAGIRASELDRLDWSHVEIDTPNPHLRVSARKQRSRQNRLVKISSNLRDWLKPLAREEGAVVPPLARKCHERLQEIAKLKPWKRDILRHTFGSYHLAHFREEGQTALEMGNSPQVIIQHYREVVRTEDAEKFWAILPRVGDLAEPSQ